MKRGTWAQAAFSRVQHHPEYLTAKLMIEINEQFCQRMADLGISQHELGRRIGKKQPYISKLFGQGTNVTLKTLVTIADALGAEFIVPRLVDKSSAEEYSLLESSYHELMKMKAEELANRKQIEEEKASFTAQPDFPQSEGQNNDFALAA